ncbi:helix-turn-helix domain-containing protein [Sphaerisporangium album]|uniref:Helix-turn-helix domain-containing protein n=2 Tax=Sphaerisporangium album TaxID=509200 RepID=A0A367EZF9_9ACTN|nr:helix-turn-helix domain-containing protein [Sphaerisporangium album]
MWSCGRELMFGGVLRDFRVRALLTQEELAALSGMSERQIRELESGRVAAPRASTVRLLADTLNLSPDDRVAFQRAAQPGSAHPPTSAQPDAAPSAPAQPNAVPSPPVQADAAPSRSAQPVAVPPAAPAQLPADVGGFTGRAEALNALDAATAAVVTVSGPAGVGKTSLAVHWSRLAAPNFPDGQLYVDLRGFSPHAAIDPAEVVRGFLDALGVPLDRIPSGFTAQVALYRSSSAGRRLLVVLDNARDADQVRPLLPSGPAARTVVTSRRRLTALIAETGATALTLDVPGIDEAVELLAHRLGPGARPEAADGDAVAAIATACGRLPLALALVGARARLTGFRPAAIAAELRHPGGRIAALEIDAVFSWSYDALSADAARLFRLLGLASGADIAVAAVAALAGRALPEVRRTLAELTDASLVVEHAPGRYRTHDLLHVYAAERARAEEPEAARQAALTRLLDHYTHTAYHADLVLNPVRAPIPMPLRAPADGAEPKHVVDVQAALEWLETEQAVLLTALRQAEEEGMHRHAWQLSWALDTFLNDRRRWQDEGAAWAVALRAATALTDRPAAAHAHRFLGAVNGRLQRFDDAHTHMREALEVSISAGDRAGEGENRFVLSYVHWLQGDGEPALVQAEQALAIFTEIDDALWAGKAALAVGWYHAELGAYEKALPFQRRALELQQRAGDRANEVVTWDTLGMLHQRLGDLEGALHHYEQGLRVAGTMESPQLRAQVLGHLGDVSEAIGDPLTARERWLEAYEIFRDLGHPQAADLRRKLRSPDSP